MKKDDVNTIAIWFTWNPLKWSVRVAVHPQDVNPRIELQTIQFGPLHALIEVYK